MSLRLRVTLGLLLVVVGAFAFLLDALVSDLKPAQRRATEEPLVDTARVLAALVSGSAKDGTLDLAALGRAFADARQARFSAPIHGLEKTAVDLILYVTDREGRVIFDSREGRDVGRDYATKNDVYLTLKGQYGARTTHDLPGDPTTSVMYVAAPITIGGKLAGVLAVGKPTRSVNQAVAQARGRVLAVGTMAAGLIVLLGWMLTTLATVPLQRLTRFAQAVRDGRKADPPRGGSREVRALITAFAEMREALEGKEYVAHYVETLTHEMKSPLAALMGAAELLEEDMPPERRARFLANIRSESARLTDLVEKMLQLASLEKRDTARDVETLDGVALANEVRQSLAPVLEARKLDLEVLSTGPATFSGERFLVRQALANLVQNALEFSPPGTTVRVICGGRAGGVELAVEDQGPGVPDYALARAFERFYSLERPDTRRRSSGLGLAFVREVAELHRGTAALANRPEGGARASLVFPRPIFPP